MVVSVVALSCAMVRSLCRPLSAFHDNTSAEVLSWNALNGRHNDLTIAQLSATTETTTLNLSSRGNINQRAFDTTLAIDGITSLLDINQWTVDWVGQVGKALPT